MTSLTRSFVLNNSSRDSISTKPSGSDMPLKAKHKSPYPVVQYRSSGQYYRYSTSTEVRAVKTPKRYIAAKRNKVPLPVESPVAGVKSIFQERTMETENATERITANASNRRTSTIEECFNNGLQPRAFLPLVSLACDSKAQDFNNKEMRDGESENVEQTLPLQARDDEPSAHDTSSSTREHKSTATTTNTRMVKALRDLYHFGQTPSNDEISSFATQESPRTEPDDERPCEATGTGSSSSNSSSLSPQEADGMRDTFLYSEEEEEEDGFCYSGLEASDFYSEDLVVEWGGIRLEDTTSTDTAGGTSTKNTTSVNDEEFYTTWEEDERNTKEKSRKRTHSDAFFAGQE